ARSDGRAIRMNDPRAGPEPRAGCLLRSAYLTKLAEAKLIDIVAASRADGRCSKESSTIVVVAARALSSRAKSSSARRSPWQRYRSSDQSRPLRLRRPAQASR